VPDAFVVSGTVPVSRAARQDDAKAWDDAPMDSEDVPTCSAKGCQQAAAWGLLWNNPKLHTADRRKVWLACDEHRTTLGDFLTARQFLRDVVPVDEIPEEAG
jgi:hypothetical protein